ncbi:MAG: hypothetical protein COB14_10020 [Alphaproteobacteria bacterium]|nr:MAG: hypothetical protein COB14_10020 [Alphaproteobacteria bacterium]
MTVIQLHQSITVKLTLILERNNKAKVPNIIYENIENSVLKELDENYRSIDGRIYLLTVTYIDDDNLDEKIEELLSSIEDKAEDRGCSIDGTFIHVNDNESKRWE